MRAVSDATLVCKRGAKGAVAFEGAIPDSLDDGQTGPGFPIEVFNVLGAGDGFFSGLLKGWLDRRRTGRPALKYANACGAFAVSRHGCTPAYPSLAELEFFLDRGIVRPDLRNDAALEQVHWATNRQREHGGDWSEMRVFAFDHRMQLEEMDGRHAREDRRLQAALPRRRRSRCADGRPGYGILCDSRLGRDALHAASGTGLWIGRPCEWPGSRPLTLEPELGSDYGGLAEWAREDVVKVLCFCHPDDTPEMRAEQEATVKRLWEASRRNRLEFLLEIIPSKVGAGRRRHHRDADPPVLRRRRLARLVEARADDLARRLGERHRGDRGARPPTPAASSCSASTRRRPSSPRASRPPPASTWSRASRSAARSSARSPAAWMAGEIDRRRGGRRDGRGATRGSARIWDKARAAAREAVA